MMSLAASLRLPRPMTYPLHKIFADKQNEGSMLDSGMEQGPVMFDKDLFARDDLPDKRAELLKAELEKAKAEEKATEIRNLQRARVMKQAALDADPDNARPTGYSNEEDDDDDDFVPQLIDEGTPEFLRFLKNAYIDSPYDNKKKLQAKSVVRSITLISFGIGVIFTAVWYAFPGKFVSVRAPTALDSTAYQLPSNQRSVYSPDDLLSAPTPEGSLQFEDTLRVSPLQQLNGGRYAPGTPLEPAESGEISL